MDMTRIVPGAALAVCLVAVLSGCSAGNSSAKSSILDEFRNADGKDLVHIDLDQMMPGDWSRMLILCPGAAPAHIDEELGFEWDYAGRDLRDSRTQLLAFATSSKVEDFVSFQDDTVYWCVSPVPEVFMSPRTVTQVNRDQATFDFRLRDEEDSYGNPVWLRVLPGS